MTKFTTPCFVHKNNETIRNKLKELGYTFSPNGYGEWNIPIIDCTYLKVDTYKSNAYTGGEFYYFTGTICKPNTGYDCEDNEELFLALAALNDSDDYMQYFYAVEDCVPRLCKSKHFEEEFAMAELYHKMSAKELIDYFKTKNNRDAI